MSKKKCCCDEDRVLLDEWCNRDHYGIDWYEQNIIYEGVGFNPTYFGGGMSQCKQPNWKIAGTLTTELPSVGHPMTAYICQPWPSCERFKNPEAGTYTERDPQSGIDIMGISSFRTPSGPLNNQAYGWGPSTFYGDVYPCWFNGINMTNIEDDDESFFDITFKLKIEKQTESGFVEIINTNISGPTKNLRPHPDAVRSYNVGNDQRNWGLVSGCGIFFERFQNGEPLPCYQDFARMPRGPWPYRFKRKFSIDTDNFDCYVKDDDGQPLFPYTVEQARELGLTQCIIEGICSPLNGDKGCCTKSFVDRKAFCDQLDPEVGTPYGWEDCPSECAAYSNHSVAGNTGNLKFFGWLEPANRYTTPEWDVEDAQSEETRKMSLHVIVPTQFKNDEGFCIADNVEGRSFGEWCFGMDCEAKGGEIEALESAGYVWSNGREKDGIWLHKTPTNALRLLFTLDHSDLDQGKVWRVFKDWDVKVTNYVKTFNEGKEDEVKFRITLEQKVTETHLSSLGCDCPSGYRQNEDGSLERVRPAGCDDRVPGLETPGDDNTCSDTDLSGPDLHCMNSLRGTKISFSERGPLVLKMDVETENFGCLNCDPREDTCDQTFGGTTKNTGNDPDQEGFKMIIHSGRFTTNVLHLETISDWINGNGIYFAANGGVVDGCWCDILRGDGLEPSWAFPAVGDNRKAGDIPSSTYNAYYVHGARYAGALADLPFPADHDGSPVAGKRYRNNYSGVEQADLYDEYKFQWAPFGFYPHINGDSYCTWTSTHCQPTAPYEFAVPRFPSFNVKDWPETGPLANCRVSCDDCVLPGRGCDTCGPPPVDENGQICICNCCNCEEIGPENCPEIFGPCAEYCGTQPGTNRSRCCTSKPEPCCECPCNTADPLCPIPPGAEPAQEGNYLIPYYRCGPNIGREEGRGPGDPYWTCHPKWPDGEIVPTGYSPDVDLNFTFFWGMDSERIYFQPLGSSSTVGSLGNVSCWDAVSCSNWGAVDCIWQYCPCENCSIPQPKFTFCEVPGSTFPYGPNRNMYINWRKYLCQKRLKGTWKPELNEIENMKFSCSVNQGDCGSSVIDEGESNACNHIWIFSYEGQTDNIPFKNFACDPNNPAKSMDVTISKYEIPTSGKFNQAWRPWDTKYEPNPGRNNDRRHIVITAKGIDG